jgi:hypothetical protein
MLSESSRLLAPRVLGGSGQIITRDLVLCAFIMLAQHIHQICINQILNPPEHLSAYTFDYHMRQRDWIQYTSVSIQMPLAYH